jgi:predicted esterase
MSFLLALPELRNAEDNRRTFLVGFSNGGVGS